jgi:hypothetical protein
MLRKLEPTYWEKSQPAIVLACAVPARKAERPTEAREAIKECVFM